MKQIGLDETLVDTENIVNVEKDETILEWKGWGEENKCMAELKMKAKNL